MAAGSTGTAQKLSETLVGEEILASIRGMRPSWVLQKCLLPQLFRYAKTFERSEARDALCPVLVFRFSRRLPIS